MPPSSKTPDLISHPYVTTVICEELNFYAALPGTTLEQHALARQRCDDLRPDLIRHFTGPEEANRVVDTEALEAWHRDQGLDVRVLRGLSGGFEIIPLRFR